MLIVQLSKTVCLLRFFPSVYFLSSWQYNVCNFLLSRVDLIWESLYAKKKCAQFRDDSCLHVLVSDLNCLSVEVLELVTWKKGFLPS